YKSGNKSWIENESSYFLASPDFFEAANLSPTSDSIKYEFADKNDSFSSYLYPIENIDKSDEYSAWRDLSPISNVKKDTMNWEHVLNDTSLPLYLSYPNNDYHVDYLGSLHAMYIQINISNNSEGFNRAIKNCLDSNNVQHLIIDFRFNGGGDYTKLAAFSKTIHQKVKGKIFIITGKATFSAGICIAARLKYFSKGRAIIIGQNSGDSLQFWAEGRQFSLPNSKIVARAVYGYHDWENDNFELFKTHWINLFFGIAAKDLTPDVPVKLLFKDYYKGIDKTMIEITTLHNTRYSH
ncbi:MAG: S41 family peptidase, partial [Bacteroidales bacterium]|nr:S41 family peptidase [Bacteroidales bacterium]